jgi:ParB-like chromosome segregation protein Spo0J
MLRVEYWPPERLRCPSRALRTHGQPGRLAGLIQKHGYWVPILATQDGEVIDGAFRLAEVLGLAPAERARLGLESIPVIPCDDLTPAQVRALRVALNKSQEWAEWDLEALALELQALSLEEIGGQDLGFTLQELEDIYKAIDLDLGDTPDPAQAAKPPKADKIVECPKCGFRWER